MTHTVETIRTLILTNDTALERGIIRVYEAQTNDEQTTGNTHHDNGVGFNGCDAEFLSSLAKQIIANKLGNPEGRRLSAKQKEIARRKMVKYAGQIFRVFVKPNQTPPPKE